ncbi:hypothetical protein BV20DRAFT_971578 [Pilatotrama ljubarskyi]|nr:hypothetical protein BV20DRAFT_971578 [Pilatotrama ljubarskyi]
MRELRYISHNYDGTLEVYGQPPPGRGSTPPPKITRIQEPEHDWRRALPPIRPEKTTAQEREQDRTHVPPPPPPPPRAGTSAATDTASDASEQNSSSSSDSLEPTPAEARDSQGKKAAKAIGKGLLGIVAAPLAVAGVGVLAVGGVLWGAGQIVKGVGTALAAGPEAAAGAFGRAMEEEAGVDEETMRQDRKRREEGRKEEQRRQERRRGSGTGGDGA